MDNTSTETIEKLVALGAAPPKLIDTPDGGFAVIVPQGYKAERFGPLEAKLPRIKQSTTFYDLAAFVAYITRFKTAASQIFATPGHINGGVATFTAILDYHGNSEKPDYKAHVATYLPPYSEPWLRWTKAQPMLQVDFAEFIEENRTDIREPAAAQLLDIVSKFRAKKTADFDSVVYQHNGELTLSYSEKVEHSGKTPLVVPQTMKLGIPVFFKGTNYEVPIFLRYKLNGPVLTFTIKVDRADYIEQAAFDEISKDLTEKTTIEVYLGKAA